MLAVYRSPYDVGQLIPVPVFGRCLPWHELGLLPTDRVPMWAAHWLVQDMDGETLRILAGLDGRDPHEVRDVLAEALTDTGTAMPSRSDAVKIAYTDMARCCLAGELSERSAGLHDRTEVVIMADYSDEMLLPRRLVLSYELDGEWTVGWGRPEPELIAAVRAACAEQIARAKS